MKGRKRVDLIMNSQVFRTELERIVDEQLKEGYNPMNLLALSEAYQNSGMKMQGKSQRLI